MSRTAATVLSRLRARKGPAALSWPKVAEVRRSSHSDSTARGLLSAPRPRLRLESYFSTPPNRGVAMTAFSDASFNYEAYLSDRPRYPPSLYARVLSFHSGSHDHALDIGCGPGLSSFPLSSHFSRITAVDPSEGMIGQGPSAWKAFLSSPDAEKGAERCQVRFLVGSAEDLGDVDEGSVDLLISAQAAHWFSYPSFWSSASRIVKPGGTVAMWGYGSNFLPHHPELWEDMAAYMSSTAPGLGPYWPQPGRSIVEGLLEGIPWPEGEEARHWDLSSRQRTTHPLLKPGVPQIEAVPAGKAFTMERVQSFAQINAYVRTSSALLRYRKAHPESASRPRPDDIDRHMEQLRAKVLERRRAGKGAREDLDDDQVKVAWPLGLMCIRRK